MLLAGPGTGKTTKIKTIIKNEYANANNILVLSFTNATVNDLTSSFNDWPNVKCYTLHSYSLKINHLSDYHILDNKIEKPILEKYAKSLKINFSDLCLLFRCITFDDMIKKCHAFIKSNPVYGLENIGNLDLLIVDEFQDFNSNERDLVYLLSDYAKETIILGDDDQSIYGFKDADPNGIIELYNRADIVKIEHENKCYRCPDIVVDRSLNLIKKNRNRIDKIWQKTNKSGNVFFKQTLTQAESNRFICQEIKKLKASEGSHSILILSPVGFYVDNLKTALSDEEITFIDFWQEKISIEEYRKIWWLRAIFTEKKALNLTFLSNDLPQAIKRKFKEKLKTCLYNDFNQKDFINLVYSFFPPPLNGLLLNQPNFTDFIEQNNDFNNLLKYLDENDLEHSINCLAQNLNPNITFDPDSVNLMSIHKSKGLQADIVFITCLVNGVLPNAIKGIDTIEAQRRLLFVGMTRAKKTLYILSSVEWQGKFVHKLDKSQFKYDYRKKLYSGRASFFIDDMM